jgi:hypothetical protein
MLIVFSTRTELGKKIERQKKEYEDKISFLLLQLRGAELQAQTNSSLLRKSFEKAAPRRSQAAGEEASQELEVRGRISSSALGYVRPRPRTAQSYISSTPVPGSSGSGSGSRGGNTGDAEEGHAGLLRKYHAEKERREVLEKRNGELARELRVQRKELLALSGR